jgi:phospholipid/cholesterol/gamma-HCH transport system substrate-binding protein
MERDANYVAVGAFAVLVIAMAVAFVLWYTKANDRRDYQSYEIYFNGSVSGLNQGSPVRYLGVDVGRVQRLSIDRSRPDSVQVIVDIDSAAPISADTRASLGLQGITGLLYINLKQINGGQNTQPPPKGEQYPAIESQASDFDVFLSSLPELVGRATTLIDCINSFVSPQNIAALNDTIANINETSKSLPVIATRVSDLVAEIRRTVGTIQGAANNIQSITAEAQPEIHDTLQRMNAVADNLNKVSARLDNIVGSSEGQLNHLSSHGLFELERLLRDVRSSALEFRDLSRSLKQNPSQLLYEAPQSGVEIAK